MRQDGAFDPLRQQIGRRIMQAGHRRQQRAAAQAGQAEQDRCCQHGDKHAAAPIAPGRSHLLEQKAAEERFFRHARDEKVGNQKPD